MRGGRGGGTAVGRSRGAEQAPATWHVRLRTCAAEAPAPFPFLSRPQLVDKSNDLSMASQLFYKQARKANSCCKFM